MQRPQNPEDYEEEGAPTLRVNPPAVNNSSTLLIIGHSSHQSHLTILAGICQSHSIFHESKAHELKQKLFFAENFSSGIILVVILAIILLIIIVIKIRAKDSAVLKVTLYNLNQVLFSSILSTSVFRSG